MAVRNENHEDLSKFGNRLWKLMEAKNIDTPRKLAAVLYNKDLVKVKTRHKDYNNDDDDKKNAIGSIEKKIRKHIDAADMTEIQGEFIVAYCKYFNCSADYLFGFTEITSDEPDIRKICDLTGLTESSVKTICRITSGKALILYGNYPKEHITTALNLILEQPDFVKYLLCLCDVSESLQIVRANDTFENVLNSIPKKYRNAALELYFDAEDAIKIKGIKPTKKLWGYAKALDDAAYDEITNRDSINEYLKEYKSNRYDLEEKHRKMAEDIVNKLLPLFTPDMSH